MNIDQLLEYDQETAVGFMWNRKGRGYKLKGEGDYAKVYSTKNSAMILKVFHDDPAYVHFLKVILDHHTNPSFPKLGKLTQLKSGRYEGLYMVKSETLSGISFPEFFQNEGFFCYLFDATKGVTPYRWKWDNECIYYRDTPNNSVPLKMTYEDGTETPVNFGNVDHYAKVWQEENSSLAAALDIVINNVGKFSLDLHEGNFIKRANGEWVITDPYFIG